MHTDTPTTDVARRMAATSFRNPYRRVSAWFAEPATRGVLEALGGSTGRHGIIGRQAWWTPLRVIIAVTLSVLSLAYLQKSPCLIGRVTETGLDLNWSGNLQLVAACYTDIIPLYGGRGLDQGIFPYAYSWHEDGITRYMEYPVLGGLFQGLMAWVANATYPVVDWLTTTVTAAAWYFAVTALVMSILWVWTMRLVAELAGHRVWDTLLVAASPLLIVYAFTNWDIPAIFLAVAALRQARCGHNGQAGILIGLGTAVKLWPLYLLGAYFVLAVRSNKWVEFLKMVAGTLAVWLVVNLPIMVIYPQAWREFLRLNSERSWEWTTIWAVLGRRLGWSGFDPSGQTPEILNTVTLVAFILACLGIAVLGVTVRRRPRVAELVTLIIIAFLLINKVWSPQYSLWLLIPAVLAVPHWRLIPAWGVVDMLLWPVLMWHMMGTDHMGAPGWLLDLFVLGRDGCIIAIGVLVIRQMLGRRKDPVRAAHDGLDPLAGSFGENDIRWLQRR